MPVSRSRVDRRKKQEDKGFDGHKRINGRKRHIIVDTLDFILSPHVAGANVQDRDIVTVLGAKMRNRFPRLHSIFADSGYDGRQNQTYLRFGWLLKVVKRPSRKQGEKGEFTVLPKRRSVERTFAWLGIFRRLAVDGETAAKMSEAFLQVVAIAITLKKIT